MGFQNFKVRTVSIASNHPARYDQTNISASKPALENIEPSAMSVKSDRLENQSPADVIEFCGPSIAVKANSVLGRFGGQRPSR